MTFNPIFEGIMKKIKSMPEDEWETTHGRRLFALAMKHAPQEFSDMVIRGAMEEGLFPKPTHCDADGNPLYNLNELAAHFGQTPEEAQAAMEEMLAFMPEQRDLLYEGPVHRMQ